MTFDEEFLSELRLDLQHEGAAFKAVRRSTEARDGVDRLVIDACLARLGLGTIDPVVSALRYGIDVSSDDGPVSEIIRGVKTPVTATVASSFIDRLLRAVGTPAPTAREEGIVAFSRTVASRVVDGVSPPIVAVSALRSVQLERWDNLHREEIEYVSSAARIRRLWLDRQTLRDRIESDIRDKSFSVLSSPIGSSGELRSSQVSTSAELADVAGVVLACARLEAHIIERVRNTDTLRMLVETSLPEELTTGILANRLIDAGSHPAYLRAGAPSVDWLMAAGYALRDVSSRRSAILHGLNYVTQDGAYKLSRYFYDTSGKKVAQELDPEFLLRFYSDIVGYGEYLQGL